MPDYSRTLQPASKGGQFIPNDFVISVTRIDRDLTGLLRARRVAQSDRQVDLSFVFPAPLHRMEDMSHF